MNSTLNLGMLHSEVNESCRMSWFVVKFYESSDIAASNEDNFKSMHCIIHSVDLIDCDLSNMFINRIVKFNQKNEVVEGTLMAATDSRKAAEKILNQILKDSQEKTENKFLLVQFQREKSDLIQFIVNENTICPDGKVLAQGNELVIRDGDTERLANVICAHSTKQYLEGELGMLKRILFEGVRVFNEINQDSLVKDNPWLLVQYSCNTMNVIYAVISFEDTVWKQENVFCSEVVYLSVGAATYQAIILRQSQDRNELELELQKFKLFSAQIKFPLTDKTVYNNGSDVEQQILEQENSKRESLNKVDRDLDNVTERTREEMLMVMETLENVRKMRAAMTKRLKVLKKK